MGQSYLFGLGGSACLWVHHFGPILSTNDLSNLCCPSSRRCFLFSFPGYFQYFLLCKKINSIFSQGLASYKIGHLGLKASQKANPTILGAPLKKTPIHVPHGPLVDRFPDHGSCLKSGKLSQKVMGGLASCRLACKRAQGDIHIYIYVERLCIMNIHMKI